MPKVCRVTDRGDHPGEIITGSDDTLVNGLKLARIGDIYACKLHGPNPLVSGSPTFRCNGRRVVRIGDRAKCGAVMITGSPDTYAD